MTHNIPGSEVRSLEEVTQEYGGGDGSEEEENSKENFTRRYTQLHQTQSESQFPAIKLTFKDSVNISQLKTIKVYYYFFSILYCIISESNARLWEIIRRHRDNQ